MLDHEGIKLVNDEVGVRWIYSFLSADRKKSYCLYEAPSAEAIREAAARAGMPADVIVPVEQFTTARRPAALTPTTTTTSTRSPPSTEDQEGHRP